MEAHNRRRAILALRHFFPFALDGPGAGAGGAGHRPPGDGRPPPPWAADDAYASETKRARF